MDATQALEVNRILLATMAGAMVIFAGALYAAVFAIGRMTAKASLVRLSYLFYGVLVVSVLVLARSLEFSGVWNALVVVLLVSYLVAPQLIWRLCEGTHPANGEDPANDPTAGTSGGSTP